jgi:hypothetical protein
MTPKRRTGFPYRVAYATDGFLDEKGFGRVAAFPFIMDHRPGYHRTANQFLIDIGLGEWNVGTRGTEDASPLQPTETTMRNYAHWLKNYLEYCHVRGKDPLKANYHIDLIQSYQGEMTSGSWSRDNVGLKGKTVNSRVDLACMFLLWAVDKGPRLRTRNRPADFAEGLPVDRRDLQNPRLPFDPLFNRGESGRL